MQPAQRPAFVTPELDEAVWNAWKEKHQAKDRVRAARRKRIAAVLIPVAALALAAYRMITT